MVPALPESKKARVLYSEGVLVADCTVMMVTSCKGGVGKSTIAANLAYTLAAKGKSILLIDLDLGNRCLDLILGLENRAVYDIRDVVMGGIPMEDAEIEFPENSRLRFCAAPYSSAQISEYAFSHVIGKARQRYDYIIIDTPGDMGEPFSLACLVSDTALIVATHGPTAIRAAGHTGAEIERRGAGNIKLIINNYDIYDKKALSNGERASVIDIIDRTSIQLIGVVPYSPELSRAQEMGELVSSLKDGNEKRAFLNIAGRIDGESILLFDGFKKISRRKII